MFNACPLYPQKRTFLGAVAMSALGQNRTHAPQQIARLFDDLVGAAKNWQRHVDAKSFSGF